MINKSQGRKIKIIEKNICLLIFRIHIEILKSESEILLNEYFF